MRHAKPLEFKSAGDGNDDEVKTALAGLTKTTTDALTKLAGDVKAIAERQDELEVKAGRPGTGGADTLNPDRLGQERKALSVFVRTGDDTELKSLSAGVGPEGGYLVHTVLAQSMIKKMFDQSPLRRLARVETIKQGDSWTEPVDANDCGATWVGEKESRPATTTADLGQLMVPVNEVYANQPVTQRLLDDASQDVGTWVEGKIADKFGRTEGAAFVNGNGVGLPRGFLNFAAASVITSDATRAWGVLQHVKSGSAAAISDADGQANGLMDLVYSLRAPYRSGASWLMNSTTAAAVRKLKDSDKNYIWQPAVAAGQPPSLLGYPVEFDENMPDIAAGTFPVAFGNWKLGYLIVDKEGIRYLRDPFTDKPNVLFYAYRRVGGDVANFEAIKMMTIAA